LASHLQIGFPQEINAAFSGTYLKKREKMI